MDGLSLYQKFALILKWFWLALILGCVLYILLQHQKNSTFFLSEIPLVQILASLVLIAISKLFMTFAAYRALKNFDNLAATLAFSFYAYNISQLPKYIPGSLWQHANRFIIYTRNGTGRHAALNSIAYENFWLLASSFALGILTLLAFEPQLLLATSESIGGQWRWIWAVLVIGLLSGLVIAICTPSIRDAGGSFIFRLFAPDFLLIGSLLTVWLCLGLSVYVLLDTPAVSISLVLYVCGVFAFAYGCGFLVPIAPAGLGIREGILIMGLLPLSFSPPALELALLLSLHRLLYLFTDIIFTGLAVLSHQRQDAVSSSQ